MFSSISWSQYFFMVAVVLVVYYLYIGFKYYGDELNAFLKGNVKTPVVTPSATPSARTTQPRQFEDSLLGKTNPNRVVSDTPPSNNQSGLTDGDSGNTTKSEENPPSDPVHTTDETHESEETETTYTLLEEIDLETQETDDIDQLDDSSIPVKDLTDLVDNIDDVLNTASDEQLDKTVLSESLRSLLEPHTSFNNGIKERISEYISASTEQTGAPLMNKKEVGNLWANAKFD